MFHLTAFVTPNETHQEPPIPPKQRPVGTETTERGQISHSCTMERTQKTNDDSGMALSSRPWTATETVTSAVSSTTAIVNNKTSVEYNETPQLWNTNCLSEIELENDFESLNLTGIVVPKDDKVNNYYQTGITQQSSEQYPTDLNVLVATKVKKPKRRKSDKKQQGKDESETNTKSKKKIAQEASTTYNVNIWNHSLSDLSKSISDLQKSAIELGETQNTKEVLNTEIMNVDGGLKTKPRRKSKLLDAANKPNDNLKRRSKVLDTTTDPKDETQRRRSKVIDAAAESMESPTQSLNMLEGINKTKEKLRRESKLLHIATESKESQRQNAKVPRAAQDQKESTRRRKSSTMQREVNPESPTEKSERKYEAQSPQISSTSTTTEETKIKSKKIPVTMSASRDIASFDFNIPTKTLDTRNQRKTQESGSEHASPQASLRERKESPLSELISAGDKMTKPKDETQRKNKTLITSQPSTDANMDPENYSLSKKPLQSSNNFSGRQTIIQDSVADALKASITKRAVSKCQTMVESETVFLERQTYEKSTYTVTSQDQSEGYMTASAEFSLPLTDYSDITSEGDLSSTVLGSYETSVLPSLESDEDQYHDEPLALYAAYTTSLADISTTGGTDTTSTLNTHTDTNTFELSTLNGSCERVLIASEDDKECKHIIPWLNETDLEQKNPLERKSSLDRKSSLKVRSLTFASDSLDERQTPKRRSLVNYPGAPQVKHPPEYARDVSLPADIAIVPHVDNRISSTTLTKDLESGSINVDPKELYLSWGSKRFRAVMNLASSKEENYQTLGAKSAKKRQVDSEDVHDVLSKSYPRRYILLSIVCYLLVPSLIIGITVPLVRRRRRCRNCDVTLAPTSSPPLSVETLKTLLVHVSSDEGDAIMAENSPQSQAFDWLVAESSSRSMAETRMIQRYALATLYFATEGDLWFVKSSWLSANDECGWFSTDQEVCNPDGELINLSLAYNSLRGELPKEVGLLTSLKILDLTGNTLSGTLPNDLGNITTLGKDQRG